MSLDHVLAVVTLAVLAAFLGTLVGFVRDIDLAIFIVLVVALAGYDFWRQLKRDRNAKR